MNLKEIFLEYENLYKHLEEKTPPSGFDFIISYDNYAKSMYSYIGKDISNDLAARIILDGLDPEFLLKKHVKSAMLVINGMNKVITSGKLDSIESEVIYRQLSNFGRQLPSIYNNEFMISHLGAFLKSIDAHAVDGFDVFVKAFDYTITTKKTLWTYIRDNIKGYKKRDDFFRSIINFSTTKEDYQYEVDDFTKANSKDNTTPSDKKIPNDIDSELFAKSIERISNGDFDGAITAALTSLEKVAVSYLTNQNCDESVKNPAKVALKHISDNIYSGDSVFQNQVRTFSSGLSSIESAVRLARNSAGDAHVSAAFVNYNVSKLFINTAIELADFINAHIK